MQQGWRGQTLCLIQVEFTFTKGAEVREILNFSKSCIYIFIPYHSKLEITVEWKDRNTLMTKFLVLKSLFHIFIILQDIISQETKKVLANVIFLFTCIFKNFCSWSFGEEISKVIHAMVGIGLSFSGIQWYRLQIKDFLKKKYGTLFSLYLWFEDESNMMWNTLYL